MSGYLKQVLITAIAAALCIGWTACGGGGTPPPCQGATCVPSATEFLYVTAQDAVSGFKLGASGAPTSAQNQSGPNQSMELWRIGPASSCTFQISRTPASRPTPSAPRLAC